MYCIISSSPKVNCMHWLSISIGLQRGTSHCPPQGSNREYALHNICIELYCISFHNKKLVSTAIKCNQYTPIVNMHCTTFALSYNALHYIYNLLQLYSAALNFAGFRYNRIQCQTPPCTAIVNMHYALHWTTSWHQKHTQNSRFSHQNTLIYTFVDKRLKILTPALPVVPGTHLRYVPNMHLHCIMSHCIALD